MGKLIQSVSDVIKYVPVQSNIDWNILAPYMDQAERKYVVNLIGDDILADILSQNTDDKKKLTKLFSSAVANLAMVYSLPILNLKISNIGATVTNNTHTKQPEWWQLKDFMRSLRKMAYENIDDALKIMEVTADLPDWKNSENYTLINNVLVNSAEVFNRWFFIGNSRQTFLALKNYLLEVENEFIHPVINYSTYNLIETSNDNIPKQVKQLLQAADVSFVISKITENNIFEIKPAGLFLRWEELPGEKTKVLSVQELRNISENKFISGNEYLKKAIKKIEDNPDVFPDYEKSAQSKNNRVEKYNSFLGF